MIEILTLSDIDKIAESSDLECKQSTGRDGKGELSKDFWPTYSAMANSDGGIVFLGIKETKKGFQLAGIENVDKIKKDLFDTSNNPGKVSVNLLNNRDVQVGEIKGQFYLQIHIRRANREERPVYLNGNPMSNTYVRRHEGDQKLSDEAVKRMLAEQTQESRDKRILKGFNLNDLCHETLKVYRQVFTNRDPNHPWNELEMRPFLEKIGAWGKNRETGENGLTAAGLLMFGYHPAIQDAFPNYILDYQERPEAKTELRWIDRVTLDGSWSGNIYDFYRKVFPKLTDGIKIPFELNGDQRVDDSPIHVAIREALCNVLVHADYSDRASILVVKRPDMFGFRNPGMMRIPLEVALQGGQADCRNRTLHQMFRYVGIGEQAGSGIPKILDSWNKYHWRSPELEDTREPYDQTLMRLRMIDLFPQRLVKILRNQFGTEYDSLCNAEQSVLVIAAVESTVTHHRFQTLLNLHSYDASQYLHNLVNQGFLEKTGSSRGAVYHLSGMRIPGPEDVFDFPILDESSLNLDESSPNLDESSLNLDESSLNLDESSPNLDENSPNLDESSLNLDEKLSEVNRDSKGRLISESHELPFIENIGKLTFNYHETLDYLAEEPRSKKKIPRAVMINVILELLDGQYITLSCLAEILKRDSETLRSQYLSQMVKTGELEIAFPRTPNDPRQAYTKVVK